MPGKIRAQSKYLGEEVIIADENKILPVTVLAASTGNITYQDYTGRIDQNESLNINNKKIYCKQTRMLLIYEKHRKVKRYPSGNLLLKSVIRFWVG